MNHFTLQMIWVVLTPSCWLLNLATRKDSVHIFSHLKVCSPVCRDLDSVSFQRYVFPCIPWSWKIQSNSSDMIFISVEYLLCSEQLKQRHSTVLKNGLMAVGGADVEWLLNGYRLSVGSDDTFRTSGGVYITL